MGEKALEAARSVSHMHPSARRRLKATLWATVILASIGLTAWGLWLTAFLFGYADAFEREVAGRDMILLGAAASAVAAAWARLVGCGWLVTLAVAGPALLVGLPDLAAPGSLVTLAGALVGIPAAFAGMLVGLLGGLTGRGCR